jgi:hypothetical protein
MISQTLGTYREPSCERCEYLTLVFSPLSAPLRSRWRNNGLSADFLGDYVITFLPENSRVAAQGPRHQVGHAVKFIANELLENAMKYHERRVDIPIGIRLELTSQHITVSASNGIGFPQAESYKAFVEHMLQADTDDMLVKQLEDNSDNHTPIQSCLGLLTMINDYGAKLGWRFEVHPEYSEIVTVTTTVILALKYPCGVGQ